MTLPKSKAELIASGTYRPSRHADRVDNQFPSDAPSPPPDLSEVESLLFNQIVETFPKGTLTVTDWPVLTMAVRWFAEWRALDKILADDPTNYKTATLAAMASKQALSAFAKLGLSPVDRRRLAQPPAKDDEDDQSGEFSLFQIQEWHRNQVKLTSTSAHPDLPRMNATGDLVKVMLRVFRYHIRNVSLVFGLAFIRSEATRRRHGMENRLRRGGDVETVFRDRLQVRIDAK